MDEQTQKTLWLTLADCWLDTEFDEVDIARIAEVVRASAASEAEIVAICKYELGPFLCWNGFTIAGEWSGFDDAWVLAKATQYRNKRTLGVKLAAWLGLTMHPAGHVVKRVCHQVFGRSDHPQTTSSN